MNTTAPEPERPAKPPNPVGVTTVDELIRRLRSLRRWAGQPSYAEIADRIRRQRADSGAPPGVQRVSRTTVYDVFRLDRTRLDVELLVEVVRACGIERDQAEVWRHTYGTVVGHDEPAHLVDARDEMPRPESYFVGRDETVTQIVEQPAGTTTVLVGMAGVGKTQVALRAAELISDGDRPQIFVALGGGDRRHGSASAESVLRTVLRVVSKSGTPARGLSVADQAAAWAAWTREHDPVVVLDDAADEAQLRLVTPPDHGGRIIVTSRRLLTGIENARAITIEPFTQESAIELLQRLGGSSGDEAVAARIAQLCGYLPLELAVTGRHIAERDGWNLDDHVRRLEQLPKGSNVGPALAAMADDLDDLSRTVFHRLSMHPGPRIAEWSTSALADVSPDEARAALRSLAAVHLVRAVGASVDGLRYEMHDLVREHASERLRDADAHRVQRAAVRRLADRAVSMTRLAVAVARPDAPAAGPNDLGERIDAIPGMATPEDGLAWLESERNALVELVHLAAGFELPEHAGALALTLSSYLTFVDDTPLVLSTLERGLITPDADVRAAIHRDLASQHSGRGRFDEAAHHLERAITTAPDPTPGRTHGLLAGIYSGTGRLDEALELELFARDEAARVGDERRRVRYTANIGNICRLLNRFEESEAALRAARAGAEELGDTLAVTYTISTLGLLFEDVARYDEALDHFTQAIEFADSIGTKFLYPQNLARMAAVRRQRGEIDLAIDLARQSVASAREQEEDNLEAEGRVELGRALVDSGRPAEALVELTAALELARRLGAAVAETSALRALGEAVLALGDTATAGQHFADAVGRAEASGDRLAAARARRGLGDVARAEGDRRAADEHYRTALEALDELSAREADELRAAMSAS